MAPMTETAKICDSAGAPLLMKGGAFARILNSLGWSTALLLVSSHAELGQEAPTAEAMTYMHTAIYAKMLEVNNSGGIDGVPIDVPPDPNGAGGSTEEEKQQLNDFKAACRWLQVVCNQQKRHSVDHTLLDVGLGDIAAQAEIENRQLSANASNSMGELVEKVTSTFHKKVCPTVRADPKMVMQLVKSYKDNREFTPPSLDSAKWGMATYDADRQRALVLEGEHVSVGKPETVEMKNVGHALAMIERALITCLLIGCFKVDKSIYTHAGDSGIVYRGQTNEHQLHFGLDAYDELFRRFILLSAQVGHKELLACWKFALVPRIQVKLDLGYTLGSAVLWILAHSEQLDMSHARYVATFETGDTSKPEEKDTAEKGTKNQVKRMNKLQKQLKSAKEQNQNLQRGIKRLKEGNPAAGKGGKKGGKKPVEEEDSDA